MPNITAKLDELQARVKTEMALFLGNQGVLLSMRKSLSALKAAKPDVGERLQQTYDSLYSKQNALETKAIDWVKRIAELKTAIMSNPDIAAALTSGAASPAMFSARFWSEVTTLTNQSLPLINEGLAISSQLVTQNGDVALLKKSVEQGTVFIPTAKTMAVNQGLIWAYGLLGLGFAYLVASGKRKA